MSVVMNDLCKTIQGCRGEEACGTDHNTIKISDKKSFRRPWESMWGWQWQWC